jgi:hypothetical protein
MSVASSCSRSCAQPAARSVTARRGASFPAALSLLWPSKLTDAGVLKSAKGNWPVYTDTPEVTADGVTADGNGPIWHYDPAIWRVGDTTYVRWTATVASADVVDDVELIDPVYIRAGYLVCKDGTGEAVVSTSWAVGDVVTAVVRIEADWGMRIGRGE